MLLLTSTSDAIKLNTSTTLAATDVQASYVDYNAGTVTPGRTNSSIAATTTTIVGAPAASTQRNVKSITVRNKDSSLNQSLTYVHTDGSTPVQLFNATLRPGETCVYSDEIGFLTYDAIGRKRERSVFVAQQMPYMTASPIFATANATSTKTITSGSTFALYMGKAPRALTQVLMRSRVTTAMATITWGEVAVATGVPVLNGNPTLTAVGFLDVSAVFNGTGTFNTTIPVSAGQYINEGDDIWILIGNSATTACVMRAQSIADDVQGGFQASATFRPSTNIGTPTSFTVETNTALAAWVYVQM